LSIGARSAGKIALLAAALGWGGFAVAVSDACLPVAGGGELTVAGIGRVVFSGLSTDRVRDAASLTGSVCLAFEAVDGVLRTERLELSGLSTDLVITAADVTLELPGWTLTARSLRSNGAIATLDEVAMEGVEAVARAATVRFDLVVGDVEAVDLRLVTETVWLDARSARFDGRRVWAADAWLTTCDCPPASAPVRLEASTVRLDLVGLQLHLDGGVLSTDFGRWRLPSPLELDESALADLTLPVTLGPDPDGRRGLVLAGREREVAPGVRFTWDAANGQDGRRPDAGARVVATTEGATVDVLAGSERLRVVWRLRRPLTPSWDLEIGQRLEGGDWSTPVRDQHVSLIGAARFDRPLPGVARVEAVGSTTVAASAQTLAGSDVIGSRWGVETRMLAVGVERDLARLTVELAGGATGYPAQQAFQAWVSVAPRWVARTGPWRIELAHLSRWVAGASPFGVTLDRRLPAHRTDLTLTASPSAIGGGWRLASSLTARLDWRADPERSGRPLGVERLRVRFDAEGPAWGGRLVFEGAADLAGWIDPRPGRDLDASLVGTWTRRQVELGARVGVAWAAGTPALRELTLFAAWPLERGDWAWRPYLAFDLASISRNGAGWWSGHGLDVAWTSCCGTVELGYRHDTGRGTSVRAGVTFDVHPVDLDRLAAPARWADLAAAAR